MIIASKTGQISYFCSCLTGSTKHFCSTFQSDVTNHLCRRQICYCFYLPIQFSSAYTHFFAQHFHIKVWIRKMLLYNGLILVNKRFISRLQFNPYTFNESCFPYISFNFLRPAKILLMRIIKVEILKGFTR